MLTPDTCAYCGAAPVYESTLYESTLYESTLYESTLYESCWTDNNLRVHSIWLCVNCDTKEFKDLVDYFEAAPYAKAPELGKGSAT